MVTIVPSPPRELELGLRGFQELKSKMSSVQSSSQSLPLSPVECGIATVFFFVVFLLGHRSTTIPCCC
jgi:hypothetical protein